MRATEKTYYNLKRLHLVFALSSSALLAVTLWMVVADHYRPWKRYQRTFRDRIEPWMTEARIAGQQSRQFLAREGELEAAVAEAGRAVPEEGLIERFRAEVERASAARGAGPVDYSRLDEACEALAARPDADARAAVLEQLRRFVDAAALRQAGAGRRLRFRRAELDQARSYYEAAVGEGSPPERLDRLQQKVDDAHGDVQQLQAAGQEASAHREALQQILQQITAAEDAARKALADHRAALDRLDRTLSRQRPSGSKRLLGAPLIDALGRPLAIDQIWLPELTIDYNFRRVARFDRCATCHRGIDRSQPGRPSQPAFRRGELLTVTLSAPEGLPNGEAAETEADKKGARPSPSLEDVYGLVLAGQGILDPDEPTVQRVLPMTPAADAMLLVGDAIVAINGHGPLDGAEAISRLIEAAEAARPVELRIRRGLPQPYCAHPRLDLMVGSLSPHPMAEFGCTICHDGQGSATDFKWASHTPDGPDDRTRWQRQHGWSGNPHWDFPMMPGRFAQSRCLKCHHAVADLEPSRRFPDPPAEKLLAGYHLIRQHGCFGCHEIKGFDDSGRAIGPDMRLEPGYAEAALQLFDTVELTEEQKALAERVAARPEDSAARKELLRSMLGDGSRGDRPGDAARLLDLLAAAPPRPGTMRKVGPSLRQVAGRVDTRFLADRIADPRRFLPGGRMPQLYGMHEHLQGRSLSDAVRFEAVEIRSVAAYLMAVSRPLEPASAPSAVSQPASAQRGRGVFQICGCLACHRHADFPKAQSVQGPDLSNLGGKYTTESGRRWLVSWIRDPASHSPRTLMPNTLLEPMPLVDEQGPSGGQQPAMTDPAADVAEYLLGGNDWQPAGQPQLVEGELDELCLLHLGKAFSRNTAQQYLRQGIPRSMADRLPADAVELLRPMTAENRLSKKLRYLGRRTIRKRGCYGCHDVAGFQHAQPIGPALSDWGRKLQSQLAFEQVHRFVQVAVPATAKRSGDGGLAAAGTAASGPDNGFFIEALLAKRREGFIWQKLTAPRSFDYRKAHNKGYNQRLTMGRFQFTDQQREAIITFVLGLVAETPAQRYVYRGDKRRRAIVEGRKVLDKYACAECHTMQMPRWTFELEAEPFYADGLDELLEVEDYDFLRPHFSAGQIAASALTDNRGLGLAQIVGMPQVDAEGRLAIADEDEDPQGNPVYQYGFSLWEPALVGGRVWPTGGIDVSVAGPEMVDGRLAQAEVDMSLWGSRLTHIRDPVGGAFARLLYPIVLRQAHAAGSATMTTEAWGWVPPPLVHEGAKVRPAWLHDYLLEPYPIRPALQIVVHPPTGSPGAKYMAALRMPKYNLSPDEAGKLVDYFAAVSGVDFPYTSDPRSRPGRIAATERSSAGKLEDAMKMLVDGTTYCGKCHRVGDYSPGGRVSTTLAPDLQQVGRRLRAEYLRRWLAHPRTVLPYTGMPVNFPPTGQPVDPQRFPGNSADQLQAAMDLLLNFDEYLKRRVKAQDLAPAADAREDR